MQTRNYVTVIEMMPMHMGLREEEYDGEWMPCSTWRNSGR